MNKGRILLFALVALLAVSCVKDPTAEPQSQGVQSVAKKIVNTSEGAAAGQLILYVNDETADRWTTAESVTRSGNAALDAMAAEFGVASIKPVFNMNINGDEKRAQGLHRWFSVYFDKDANVETVAQKFAEMKEVKRVEYATILKRPQISAVPAEERVATRASEDMPYNDPMLELQWHYDNQGLKSIYETSKKGEDINAFAAWKYTPGNREVIVAVMDEGVKYNHPDLIDNMWTNDKELNGSEGVDDDKNGIVDDIYGVNCVDYASSGKLSGNISWDQGQWKTDAKGNSYFDGDTGHGTHVAGTVAAVNNNGIGVAGVAGGSGNGDGVRIMSIQIFDGDGNSSYDTNARGIEYAADHGACILQCSWGYPLREGAKMSDSDYEMMGGGAELAALRYFVSQSGCSAMDGNVAIFAAGNEAKSTADYPGAYHEFIAVTAYAPDGLPTSYTNYKEGCNVSAPGGDWWIFSQYDWSVKGCVLSTIPAETIDPSTGSPYNTDYGYMQGTSMACPHVSGVAALVVSYALENGIKITNTQLYDVLTSAVRDIDTKLAGTKTIGYNQTFALEPYKGNMGTGKLDALMAIQSVRGTLCVPAIVGEEVELDPSMLIGGGSVKINVTGYTDNFKMSEETKNRLGIDKIDTFGGKVYFTPKNSGIGMVTIKYIAGGKSIGGGGTTGGKLMEKDVVVVVRDVNDNGGWF